MTAVHAACASNSYQFITSHNRHQTVSCRVILQNSMNRVGAPAPDIRKKAHTYTQPPTLADENYNDFEKTVIK
jgi:hypothetical protein